MTCLTSAGVLFWNSFGSIAKDPSEYWQFRIKHFVVENIHFGGRAGIPGDLKI